MGKDNHVLPPRASPKAGLYEVVNEIWDFGAGEINVSSGTMNKYNGPYNLISRTCQYMILHGKQDFANKIDVMNPDIRRLFSIVQVNLT